eukprot:TRINITY_DN10766_c0_g2_i1.p2 TRINITY_DN10766_c0_g2~~TRINITY_DN10766_c0_g2_i1.p2  ORF type:complete len:105 (-),score=9.67 TRINITY_DN10766_c0_g2_i1:542-856(-)
MSRKRPWNKRSKPSRWGECWGYLHACTVITLNAAAWVIADHYFQPNCMRVMHVCMQVCGQLPAEQEFDVSAMLEPRLAELRQDLKCVAHAKLFVLFYVETSVGI